MNGLFGIAAQQLDYTLCQVYICKEYKNI